MSPRRFSVSIDMALRTDDLDWACATYDAWLVEHGLGAASDRQARTYRKGDINSRVAGNVIIEGVGFGVAIARLRRLDAAIFGAPSLYLRIDPGPPSRVEIVGPSPDDPIDDPEIVWVNIEAEDTL